MQKVFENVEDGHLTLLSTRASYGPSNNPPQATLLFNELLKTLVPLVYNNVNTQNAKVNSDSTYRTITKNSSLRILKLITLLEYIKISRGR